MPSDLTDIKAGLDFRTLVQETHEINHEGKVHCPFHDDHHPSCHIYPDGFKCFACDAHGDHILWLQQVHHLSKAEAIEELKRRAGVTNQPRQRRILETYDYTDDQGELSYQVVRFDPKSFAQRHKCPKGRDGYTWGLGGKKNRCGCKAITPVLYRLPKVIEAVHSGRMVFVVEGERDVHSLEAVGKVATCNPMGAGKWREHYADVLDGGHVVIMPDNDEVGIKHAQQVAQSLFNKAASIKVVQLPGLAPRGDVSDWLADGHAVDELDELVDAAPLWQPEAAPPVPKALPSDSGRPQIPVNNRFLREIAADALQALEAANAPPFLFLRGSVPVRVNDGRAEIMTQAALKGVLDRVADFVKLTPEPSPARPPGDLPADLMALPSLPFPSLNAISTVPVFLPNGTLLAQGGYDPDSGILLRLDELDPIRSDMSTAEARALLAEVFADFPFADQAAKAHTLAMTVQPFVRPLIHGPTPLYMVDAPARGTGKGLLTEVAALIVTGGSAPVMALPRDNDETEKRITSALLEGSTYLLLDNVTELRSTALAAVLTAETWRGRRLGKSEMLTLGNDATWVATGNNIQLSDELVRRVIPIRLDAGVERPEERRDFRHSNLPAWARLHRSELVSACLSLIQAWVDAGMPKGDETLGRYESWAGVIGGILSVSGISGFLSGRERLHAEADKETTEWAALCESWYKRFGHTPVSAKDLFEVVKEHDLLLDLWAGRSPLGALQKLGHALQSRRDRVFGEFTITSAGKDSHTRNAAYRLLASRKIRGREKTPETPETTGESPQTQSFWGRLENGPANGPAKRSQNTGDKEAVEASVPGVSGVSGVYNRLHSPEGGEDDLEWEEL